MAVTTRSLLLVVVVCIAAFSYVNGDTSGATLHSTRAATAKNADHSNAPPVDYSNFAKMLAGVLVLREGGIPEATQAIANLAATSHHYLNTQVFLNKHPEIQAKIKNFTDFHSYKENVDLLGKITEKLQAKGAKIGKVVSNEKDQNITAAIQAKIDKITSKTKPPKYDAELAKLNTFLGKFHLSLTPKSISAPSKFANFAGAISSSITGLSLSASGITWAPALVSYGGVGLSASATGLSITPTVIAGFPSVFNFQPQLANIAPTFLSSFPDGVNVQPQGVNIGPNLMVVAPTGVNVAPQGVSVGASGFVTAPTGVNVQPQGIAWGPVNTILP